MAVALCEGLCMEACSLDPVVRQSGATVTVVDQWAGPAGGGNARGGNTVYGTRADNADAHAR